MKRKKLPRLCRVLGVVPGEIFSLETSEPVDLSHCWVEEDGLIYCKVNDKLYTVSSILCEVINHPESVTYRTPFTPAELTLIRSIRTVHPTAVKLLWSEKGIRVLDKDRRTLGRIAIDRLPTMKSGEPVELEKIMGGLTDGATD